MSKPTSYELDHDAIPFEDVIFVLTPDHKGRIMSLTPRGQALADLIEACKNQAMSGEDGGDAINKAIDVLTIAHLTRRLAVDPKTI